MTEVLRAHAEAAKDRYALSPLQRQVLHRLVQCRTAAMGSHVYTCPDCGYRAQHFNPCRDRHCPQCQAQRRAVWLQARLQRMLPVPHFQLTFTLPAELRPLARAHPKAVFDLLFRSATSVLADLAAQRLHATLGLTAVLHTWARNLSFHPHVHCLVTAGGLASDGSAWHSVNRPFLFPGRILQQLFRGRFLHGLCALHDAGALRMHDDPVADGKAFAALRRALYRKRFVVHVEPPLDRPVAHLVKYLARYVYSVAIADPRLLAVTEHTITFATRGPGTLTLTGPQFVQRFLQHVLPKGFVKVRHYGLYAPVHVRTRLRLAHRLLAGCAPPDQAGAPSLSDEPRPPLTLPEATPPPRRCPDCGTPLLLIVHFPTRARGPPSC